jgi:hypothetical protein
MARNISNCGTDAEASVPANPESGEHATFAPPAAT